MIDRLRLDYNMKLPYTRIIWYENALQNIINIKIQSLDG